MFSQTGLPGPVPAAASYLPRYLRRRAPAIAEGQPLAFPFRATAVMADISGFTALTEQLSQEGAGGLERLTRALNDCLGRINAITARHGGDPDVFSGDAVLAVWHDSPGGIGPQATAERAARCAAELIAAVDGREVASGIRLRLRVAVVSGALSEMYIGGHGGRWKHLLSGRPLFDLSRLLDEIGPGQIAVDAGTEALLGGSAGFGRSPGGTALLTRAPADARPEPGPGLAADPAPEAPDAAALAAFLPRVVADLAAAPAAVWTGEFRTLTTMFISLTGIDVGNAGDLAMIQSSVEQAQAVVYRLGGSIHSVAMNDKGPMIMVVFGLPNGAHEDDACRAVLAARELQAILGALWLDSTCGIATGPAFCGSLGPQERRSYAILGPSVNLAARLQANGRYRVLCDAATQAAAAQRIRFERMADMTLKGMAAPVAVFCPRQDVAAAPASGRPALIGREAEATALTAALLGPPDAAGARVVVLQGEAGLGKSSLIAGVVAAAESAGIEVLEGTADPYSQHVPFQAWRRPFARLLGIEGIADAGRARAAAQARIAAVPGLARAAALFGAVLPFEMPDSQFTVEIRGDARLDRTMAALAALAGHRLADRPALVVLDDVHWLDSASWALVGALLRDPGPLRFLLASRPAFDPAEAALAALAAATPIRRILLRPFAAEATAQLIATAVGAAGVDPPLAAFIQEKSGGNPFYIGELARALAGDGTLAVDAGGQARLAVALADLERAGFPDSIERTVIARFDRLPQRQQRLLKVASVVGSAFGEALIGDLVAQGEGELRIEADLAALVEARLLDRRDGPAGAFHQFTHAIARDVIYGLLLPSDRQAMHAAVADRLAREGDPSLLPALAEHHARAGAHAAAADCFERSGIAMLAGGTNRESIELLGKALAALRQGGVAASPLRLARIHRHLGEAHNRLGLPSEALTHLQAGLESLGLRWPRRTGGMALATTRHLATQALRQTLRPPHRAARLPEDRRARAEEVSQILHHLGHTLFFLNRGVDLVLLVCAQVNFAEDSGNAQMKAHAYLQISNVMGIFGLHRAARHYQNRFAPLRDSLPKAGLARCNQLQSLYLGAVGAFARCRTLLQEALAIADEIGDQRYRREFTSLLGIVALPLGDLDEAAERRAAFRALAAAAGDRQAQVWAGIETAEIALQQGRPAEAIGAAEATLPLAAEFGAAEQIWAEGVLARALWESGAAGPALDLAGRTLGRILRTVPVGYYTYEGYAGVAEVFIAALEARQSGETAGGAATDPATDPAALRRRARRALRALAGFARSFPFVRPRLAVLRARLELALGQAAAARRRLPGAAAQALALELPLEAARAELVLAGLERDEARLARAAAAFRARGAALDLAELARVCRRAGLALP